MKHRSNRKPRGTWIPLFALALLLVPLAEGQKKNFDDTATVVAIEVPVNVTVDGEPVRGLTVDNFEILDGATGCRWQSPTRARARKARARPSSRSPGRARGKLRSGA